MKKEAEVVTGELDGISAMRKSVGLDAEDKDIIKTIHKPVADAKGNPVNIDDEEEEEEIEPNPFELKLEALKKANEEEEEEGGPSKKVKKTPEENMAALRKSRDELKKRVEELEANGSPALKPIGDLLHQETGELVTEKSVKEFVESYSEMKSRVDELQGELEKTEGSLKNISIKASKEWKDGYEKPYIQATNILGAELLNLDSQGEPKHKDLIEEYTNGLISHVQDEGSVDMLKVKASLKQFAARYEELTGDEYEPPSMRDLNSSLNEVVRMRDRATEALTKWEEDKAARDAENGLTSKVKEQEATEAGKRVRFQEASEALNGFDLSSVEGIFDPSEVTEAFNDTFKGNESAIANPSEAPSYSEVLSLQTKGALYDKLLQKYKESVSEISEIKGSKMNGRYGSDILVGGIKKKEEDTSLAEMRKSAGFR